MSLKDKITKAATKEVMSVIASALQSSDVDYPKNLDGGAKSEVPIGDVSKYLVSDVNDGKIFISGSDEHKREYMRAGIYGNLFLIIKNKLHSKEFAKSVSRKIGEAT